MRHYQLTPNIALILKPAPTALKWFAGRTNRLALYSVCVCGLELDLYIARQWKDPLEDDAPEYLEDLDQDAPSEHRISH